MSGPGFIEIAWGGLAPGSEGGILLRFEIGEDEKVVIDFPGEGVEEGDLSLFKLSAAVSGAGGFAPGAEGVVTGDFDMKGEGFSALGLGEEDGVGAVLGDALVSGVVKTLKCQAVLPEGGFAVRSPKEVDALVGPGLGDGGLEAEPVGGPKWAEGLADGSGGVGELDGLGVGDAVGLGADEDMVDILGLGIDMVFESGGKLLDSSAGVIGVLKHDKHCSMMKGFVN